MLLQHMDTPPPDINLRALLVSIFPRSRVMKGDLPCSGPALTQILGLRAISSRFPSTS